jgi:calcium-dependent protein kinase
MCDLWSCGVIMYTVLCGYPPFNGRCDAEVLQKVRQGSFEFRQREWSHISADAKTLVRMLLAFNPSDRCTAGQALKHDWILHKAPHATQLSLKDGMVDNLRAFNSQSKLKKAALQIIAGQLSEAQIKGLRETFVALDENGDGLLTFKELKDGLSKAGLHDVPADLQQIMDSMDVDGSGAIDYTEFLAATLDKRAYLRRDVCWTAFSVFDLDGDGKISLAELQKVLGNESVGELLEADSSSMAELLREIDRDGDGAIDFAEFMAMMQGPHQVKGVPSERSNCSCATNEGIVACLQAAVLGGA